MSYKLCTESAQSRGPENIGPERTLPGLLTPRPVLSPSRITLENNGKIRPQPDRENAFAGASGGGRGIRTEGPDSVGRGVRADLGTINPSVIMKITSKKAIR